MYVNGEMLPSGEDGAVIALNQRTEEFIDFKISRSH